MIPHARAILWVQLRSLLNFYSRGHTGSLAFTAIFSVAWYGLAIAGGIGSAILASDPKNLDWLHSVGPSTLAFIFVYWQIVPLLLASTGVGLDLKRLLVYPVSQRELFSLEVLLRFSTGIEMMCILTGATAGLLANPSVRWWGPLAFIPWIGFNLFLATGLRELLGRILARRKIREVAVILFVLLAALPQLALVSGMPERLRSVAGRLDFNYWPWRAAARLSLSSFDWPSAAALLAWTAAAYWFGKRQFERGLRFDAEAARATGTRPSRSAAWLEPLYRLPSLLFPDPLAALYEKELRFLSRAPRFRIVFLMGFSFGLIIWLPMAWRYGSDAGFFAQNFLTFVTVYALLLLGEVSFWNTFGFDRGAVQVYYVMPVKLSRVLMAKNLSSVTFVLLEISAVAAACATFRMPMTLQKLVESYLVTLVITLYLLAVGNLGSTWWPRPVNPSQSWRSASAGRFQALLMLLYPVVSIPVALAYLARYAFESDLAFFGALAVGAAVGCAFYWVAMDSAIRIAERRKEQIVTALSAGEGPITT